LREYFNADGRLVKSQEKQESFDYLNITWFYNQKGEVIRAESDNSGNGIVDTWYYYDKGVLTAVQEDTNADGKPDRWEEYDESEVIVRRSIDINFDGKPDVVENIE
jgi:hypothetical protein